MCVYLHYILFISFNGQLTKHAKCQCEVQINRTECHKIPPDKMSLEQIVTGQNVTRTNCHSTKCPKEKMSHNCFNVTGQSFPFMQGKLYPYFLYLLILSLSFSFSFFYVYSFLHLPLSLFLSSFQPSMSIITTTIGLSYVYISPGFLIYVKKTY